MENLQNHLRLQQLCRQLNTISMAYLSKALVVLLTRPIRHSLGSLRVLMLSETLTLIGVSREDRWVFRRLELLPSANVVAR